MKYSRRLRAYDELAYTSTGASVVGYLLHTQPHENDRTYCIALSMADSGMFGGWMSRMIKAELTYDEALQVLDNPGQSPFPVVPPEPHED
jgi:hypothetical protein